MYGPVFRMTPKPGNEQTIADVFDQWKESPYPDYAFRVRLVDEDGQERESVVCRYRRGTGAS